MRKHEGMLFWDSNLSRDECIGAFYKIIRHNFPWLREQLKKHSLEQQEIDSELYVFCRKLYLSYDRDRSSIVPYLENQLPWHLRDLFRHIEQSELKEQPVGLTTTMGETIIDEEFYLKNLLFEDRWLGKRFTRSQKYLIIKILMSDDKEITQQALSRATNMERKRTTRMLQEIKEILEETEYATRI